MVGPYGPLVGAIDQGTSSSRFLVFAARTSELVTYHQEPVATSTPRTGWVEQDPCQLIDTVTTCVEKTVSNLRQLGVDPADIVCVGVANQRETTIVWDKTTGRPLHPAIVWSDVRTSETVSALLARLPKEEGSSNVLIHRSDKHLSLYFLFPVPFSCSGSSVLFSDIAVFIVSLIQMRPAHLHLLLGPQAALVV